MEEEKKQNKQQKQQQKDKNPDAAKEAGKMLTPDEKKAQRDAVNAAKAAKKAEAAAKKAAKAAAGGDEPKQEKKPKKDKPKAEAKASDTKASPAPQSEPKASNGTGLVMDKKDSQNTATTNRISEQIQAKLAGQKVMNTGKQKKMSVIHAASVLPCVAENESSSPGIKSMSISQQPSLFKAMSIHEVFSQNQDHLNMNPSRLVSHIYTDKDVGGSHGELHVDIHPAIHDVGVKLISDHYKGTNQITVAILLALKEVTREFTNTKRMIYHQELLQLIRDSIIPYLNKCKPLLTGTKQALQFIRTRIGKIAKTSQDLQDMKNQLLESIDEFIMERIIYAQVQLIENALKLFSDKREEVILTYGNQESQTVEDLFKKAHQQNKQFRVIVVDSAPEYQGRNLVKRLARSGIKCQYTLINMVNFVIGSVTKVILPSTYVLGNGALVAPIGTSMIGCIAKQNQIPVIVACESYKLEDRVNLDQINHNEHGSYQKFVQNYLRQNCPYKDCMGEIQNSKKNGDVTIINFRYDLTLQKYLSIIVCEIGNVPPHSVPIVIREIVNEQENEDEVFADSSSEVTSSDNEEGHSIYDNDAWNIVEGNDGPDMMENKLSAREIATANKRAKMAAQMRESMEMEEVNEDDEEDSPSPTRLGEQ